MKVAVLLSLFAATSAQVTTPRMLCKVVDDPHEQSDTGKTCNKLRQSNRGNCAPGEKKEVQIRFTSLAICDAGDDGVDEERSYLWLRGPAIKNVYGGPVIYKWNEMEDATANNPSCKKKTLDLKVDKCSPYFNAELFAYTVNNSAGSETVFDTYMRRNCPMTTSITCTAPNGQPCEELAANNCQSGDFVYKFCYETSLSDHDITIRKNYINARDCDLPGCNQETHAYIGGFVGIGTFIGNGFPKVRTIGRSRKRVCQRYTETVATSTCDIENLPKAYMNVVGQVSAAYDNGAAVTEWKNCFDSTKYNFLEFSNPGDRNGGDCGGSKTKSPSSKGTKAPSSKGTKAPKKCSGDSPSKGGTKAPSSKGTKAPSVRKLRKVRY